MLAKHNLQIKEIDAVMTGINGDKDNDAVYHQLQRQLFPETPMAWYKHLFGESFTACGLGMFTAATAIQEQLLPADYLFNRDVKLKGIKPYCYIIIFKIKIILLFYFHHVKTYRFNYRPKCIAGCSTDFPENSGSAFRFLQLDVAVF